MKSSAKITSLLVFTILLTACHGHGHHGGGYGKHPGSGVAKAASHPHGYHCPPGQAKKLRC